MISHCELEGSFRFMLDYFGLDFRELGNVGVYDPETLCRREKEQELI